MSDPSITPEPDEPSDDELLRVVVLRENKPAEVGDALQILWVESANRENNGPDMMNGDLYKKRIPDEVGARDLNPVLGAAETAGSKDPKAGCVASYTNTDHVDSIEDLPPLTHPEHAKSDAPDEKVIQEAYDSASSNCGDIRGLRAVYELGAGVATHNTAPSEELTFTVEDVRRIIRRRAIMLRERAQRIEGNKGDSVRRITHNQIADLLDRYAKRFPHLAGDIAEPDDQIQAVLDLHETGHVARYDGQQAICEHCSSLAEDYVEYPCPTVALLVPTSKENDHE